MKRVCCDTAAPFGEACEPCERGGHEFCTRPVDLDDIPLDEEEVSADIDVQPEPEPAVRPKPGPVDVVVPPEFYNNPSSLWVQRPGVWVAYHSDLSEVWLFDSEIECLRFAVKNYCSADLLPYGVGLRSFMNSNPSTE